MLLLITLSLAGCVGRARVGVEYCDYARPIYFASIAEVDLTPANIRRQVLETNVLWRKICRM